VTAEYGWSANMERIMKAQALGDTSVRQYMNAKKILEINPRHPIIQYMRDNEENSNKDFVWMLYESSLISSGFTLDEPNAYVARIYNIIESGLSIDQPENESSTEPSTEPENESSTEPEKESIDKHIVDEVIVPTEEFTASTDIVSSTLNDIVNSTAEEIVITPAEVDIEAVQNVITHAEETVNC
jgi:molecular chaperone HtpG